MVKHPAYLNLSIGVCLTFVTDGVLEKHCDIKDEKT